jgi:hypothetical protein
MSAGEAIQQVCGDRGFDSQANRELLEKDGIYNAICPKSLVELKKRMKDSEFVKLQQRRSPTEARISIFKNGFLGIKQLSSVAYMLPTFTIIGSPCRYWSAEGRNGREEDRVLPPCERCWSATAYPKR